MQNIKFEISYNNLINNNILRREKNMEIYNRELEKIENEELQSRMASFMEREIEFLTKTYGIDEELLRRREKNLIVVERNINDSTCIREVNGKKTEFPKMSSAAAFTFSKSQTLEEHQMTFENAIYINPEGNSGHAIMHELFHYFSDQEQIRFNELGEGDYKGGVSITVYNRDDEEVDGKLSAGGLNEGITELLASNMLKESPMAYEAQVYIANILIGSQHQDLIKAYFSEDRQAFEDFARDFDKRQVSTSFKKLVDMSQNGWIALDVELLKGCTEYALSFCRNREEFIAEKGRLVSIYKKMLDDINVECDTDVDLKEIFNEIASKRKEEIKRSMHPKEKSDLLQSAIEATEEKTRSGEINEQISNIRQLAVARDEKTVNNDDMEKE